MAHLKTTKRVRLAAAAIAAFSANAWAAFPYLDDSNKTAPGPEGLPSIEHHLFPRVHQHEMMGDATPAALSKYNFIETHGISFDAAEAVQALSPGTMVLRHISGRGYQGYTQTDPCYVSTGIAFGGTGPVSQGGPQSAGCDIYAGHWLYKAGSRLTLAADAGARTLSVEDASRFENGQYVVIYDAPAGSFGNAEHALVVSRDLPGGTITLESRGYKSTPAARAAGSIVAQHVLGQGTENKLWALNFSTRSAKDGNGKTWGDFYAGWLTTNLERSKSGQVTSANIAGIMLDADFYFELIKKYSDADNDLVTDNGMSSTGENWLGDGLDQFYKWIELRAPSIYLLSGVHDGRGYESAHGNQMESWPDYGNADFSPDPQYRQINSVMAMYLYNTGSRSRGTPLVVNLTKTPTRLYPGNASPAPADNRPFRLALALTLMENGYFGTHSRYTPDAWWDEFAVDVSANSPTYGRAIPKTDIAGIHRHRGWLGKPLGEFARVYREVNFGPERSLIANGTFDSSVDGWSPANVSVSRTAGSTMDGAGALWVSTMNSYQKNLYAARVRSEAVSLIGGKGYTLAFSARADRQREIAVSVGSESNVRIPLGPKWRRYVIGFHQNQSQSGRVTFQLGREDSQVWFDSAYLFAGNTNVFRREFEHGIVVANATSVPRTIELGGLYRRIIGTQDPAVNSGQSVTAVTLAPYDGVVLVRPPGAEGG